VQMSGLGDRVDKEQERTNLSRSARKSAFDGISIFGFFGGFVGEVDRLSGGEDVVS
jgi:hypothetical protein